MVTEVFSTVNPYTLNVRWKKGTTIPVPTTRVGLCVGMTIIWIKKSMANGALNSFDELGSVSLMGVISSAYNNLIVPRVRKQLNFLQEMSDFLLGNGLSVEYCRYGLSQFDPFMNACDISLREGFHLIYLMGNLENMGHVMGTRVQGNELDFFDSTLALYRFNDSAEFMHKVSAHIYLNYQPVLNCNWYIARVTPYPKK
ncbi:C58 family peptidase [Endozoicomonas gorgoniicola]|uniref:C58 family peptidase n=1 Tax=Endozoicomonas gorgoniicola TaxID=1234144 RepID=A0ABT3MVG1_9GAMM|nr:C58 family peptidase [Endozoicomonas gorgoniicola]MCW7553374.1 C58 family peptidase [Endozoicomonas gorgoniicola]